MKDAAKLAVNGGPKVRTTPWPERGLVGMEEKRAVDALFDAAIRTGQAPGYNGVEEEAYCREFAAALGGGYADGVNSGSTAVYVALKALGVEPFTEVVVGALTDPGGMMPIPLLNCIPVVADAAPGCYNTGPAEVEGLLSPLTSAIVVAHIGGEPADIEGIVRVASKRGIPVVEDCAQSHGARLHGRPVGTFGSIAAFSTMFGKHHCTGGQGGVVFTRDMALHAAVRRAADRGKPFDPAAGFNAMVPGATNETASLNFNLSEFQAAMGRVQLAKLPGIVERRRALVADITRKLAGCPGVIVPPQLPGAESSWWWWRLAADLERLSCDKESYCRALQAEGLPINPFYRATPHTYTWFRERRVFGTSGLPWSSPSYKGDPDRTFPCPNVMRTIDRQFNLTVYETWGAREADDVAAIFRKVGEAYAR